MSQTFDYAFEACPEARASASAGALPSDLPELDEVSAMKPSRIGRTLLATSLAIFPLAVSSPALAGSGSGARTIVAAPAGTGDRCTESEPCSLPRAQARAREFVMNAGGEDVTVLLRGGTYYLAEPLVFDARDSGSGDGEVTYQAFGPEVPVLSGGRQIHGWSHVGDGLFRAEVGDLVTRHLFVDGQRAVRARSGANPAGFAKTDGGYLAPDDSMASWQNISDIEILSNVYWRSYRCGLDRIEGRLLVVDSACWANAQIGAPFFSIQQVTWIENAKELLDEPGEWYLDRDKGQLYYKPLPGQDMQSTRVVAGVLEELIRGEGTLDSPIRNLRFVGLVFADTTWLGPDSVEGYVEVFAGFRRLGTGERTPSAVSFLAARNVTFSRNIFTRLGQGGLNLEHGSQDNLVSGNHFADLSGAGIHLGGIDIRDHHPTDGRIVVRGNEISNNYISRIGQEFFGSVGIWNGYTQDTLIAHNELTDLPYSAISSGWGWGCVDPGGNSFLSCNAGYEDPTTLGDVHIVSNRIHDIMQVNSDGGGIYTMGAQAGSTIEGNYISGLKGAHPRIGLYFDSGSRYILVERNLVHDAPLVLFDKGGDLVFKNNYWTVERTAVGEDACRAVFQSKPNNDACRRFWEFGGENIYRNNHDVDAVEGMPRGLIERAGLQPRYRSIANVEIPR